MGLGYYGAWLMFGINIKDEKIENEKDGCYINGVKYDDENFEIHEYGDNYESGTFLICSVKKGLKGGGMWDDGGNMDFKDIKKLYKSFDDDRREQLKKFCDKFKIEFREPTFCTLVSAGDHTY
jgi:hypothetical protein